MPTPHIAAEPGEFAESVLLPGDPLRAEYIAENFLDDAVQVTDIRNMYGFTGTSEGNSVSVMGTGMGIPSASIYVTELVDHYGVRRLVRVGSCGGIAPDLDLRDVIVAIGASTDSGSNRARYAGWDFAEVADFALARAAVAAAHDMGIPARVGTVHTTDHFYNPVDDAFDIMEGMGILAVEMEVAGLYGVAAERGARALAVLTVSDHVRTGASTDPEERERSFDDMVRVALRALQIDDS
jgi:purine-nucleoside phosphorylase